MKLKYLASAIVVFAVATAGCDRVAEDSLPGLSVTKEQVGAMTAAERERLLAKMMAEAATKSRKADEPIEPLTTGTPLMVAVGRFTGADATHKGSGQASLHRLADGRHLIRLEDFEVTNGPALVVLLVRAVNPKDAKDVQRGYIKIGDLKGNIGNQNYEIPQDINVGLYRSVVIWCELFDVMFSAATLNVT